MTESSDREIYKAIMEAINAHETIDINGGDYVEDIGPEEPQVVMSRLKIPEDGFNNWSIHR